jgi:hypothetical protein
MFDASRAAAALLMILIMLTALPSARAATLAGVTMPEQTTLNGKTLVLNGLGLRTATFLKVKVYVIGLYLESKSSDAKGIIDSSGAKRVEMRFVHDVSASELRDGWSEAFENNYPDVASIKSEIAQFNASMRDVKSGDTIALDFRGTAVDVLVNGKTTDSVEGSAFQRAALGIWLGPEPPSEDLKNGILGK